MPSSSASGLTIQVNVIEDAKALAEYMGVSGMKYELIKVTIINDRNSPLLLYPQNFTLIGSDDNTYTEVSVNNQYVSTIKPTSLGSGQSIIGFIAFLIPYGVQPKTLEYPGISISLTNVRTLYLSVINVTFMSNDSEVKVLLNGNPSTVLVGVNGQNETLKLQVQSYHNSLPVILNKIIVSGNLMLIRYSYLPLVLAPEQSYSVDAEVSFTNSSIYGTAQLEFYTSINSTVYSGIVNTLVNDTVYAINEGVLGESYLAYNVTVSYDGGSIFILNPSQFVLITNSGNYSAQTVYLPGVPSSSKTVSITSSGKAVETLIFKVPTTSKPLVLEYVSHNGQIAFRFNAYTSVTENVLFINHFLGFTNDSKVSVNNIFLGNSITGSYYNSGYYLLSTEKIPVIVYITNNHGQVPVEAQDISIKGPATVFTQNYTGTYILQGQTNVYQIILNMNNISYIGNITISLDTSFGSNLYNISVLDVINASAFGQYLASSGGSQGLTFIVYNISLYYQGPGKFNFNPANFVLVTSQGSYTYYNYVIPNGVANGWFDPGARISDWIPGLPTPFFDRVIPTPGMQSSTLLHGYGTHGYLVFGIPTSAIIEKLIYKTSNNLTVFSVNANIKANEYISGVPVVVKVTFNNGFGNLTATTNEVVFGIDGYNGYTYYIYGKYMAGNEIGPGGVTGVNVVYPSEPPIKVYTSEVKTTYDYYYQIPIQFLQFNQSYWSNSSILNVHIYDIPKNSYMSGGNNLTISIVNLVLQLLLVDTIIPIIIYLNLK
ncbi:hypothetical protein M1627_0553 [Sulfolobus islandicus M.16.27]|uniref:DUF4352 domain-containing protein n=1 Tax=Saccharolobus islandicus (strain M.16.27) TaxID=427318 RepID=C3N2P6_SACI3|nr:hypothetical protein M1627_0553 [Sulfolobus islandicus M.16.27]